MPKLSIIIPVYNAEKYIRNCLDNILNQGFFDYECILVNDGSKDNSEVICSEYVKKDQRFKLINKV
ncbi:MAG: glycosyltransferase family 2 protein, partial [Erysipelotrichaceae bacterium]|nr:glycosyltransferase family 2 protein [Erysipelotrichaceae bacterium]